MPRSLAGQISAQNIVIVVEGVARAYQPSRDQYAIDLDIDTLTPVDPGRYVAALREFLTVSARCGGIRKGYAPLLNVVDHEKSIERAIAPSALDAYFPVNAVNRRHNGASNLRDATVGDIDIGVTCIQRIVRTQVVGGTGKWRNFIGVFVAFRKAGRGA